MVTGLELFLKYTDGRTTILSRVLKIDKPSTRAGYALEERDPGQLRAAIERLL